MFGVVFLVDASVFFKSYVHTRNAITGESMFSSFLVACHLVSLSMDMPMMGPVGLLDNFCDHLLLRNLLSRG